MTIFLTILGFGAVLFHGYALQNIWAWSAVPLFPGLPLITFWQSVGLGQLALWCPLYFSKTEFDDHKLDTAGKISHQIVPFIRSSIAMGVSWFAHWMQS